MIDDLLNFTHIFINLFDKVYVIFLICLYLCGFVFFIDLIANGDVVVVVVVVVVDRQ